MLCRNCNIYFREHLMRSAILNVQQESHRRKPSPYCTKLKLHKHCVRSLFVCSARQYSLSIEPPLPTTPPCSFRDGVNFAVFQGQYTDYDLDYCPQRTVNGTEDCLYLGLFSRPWSTGQALRPVVVNFFGGAYIEGGGSFSIPPSTYPTLNVSSQNDWIMVRDSLLHLTVLTPT